MIFVPVSSGTPNHQIDNWGGGGGHIFIYSCHAQLISFEIDIKILKSIVFTVCEQEYMNMCPRPPKYRSSGVPDADNFDFHTGLTSARSHVNGPNVFSWEVNNKLLGI